MSDICQDIETFSTLSDSLLYDIIEKYFCSNQLLNLRMVSKNYYNKTNYNNLFKLMFLNLRNNYYLIHEHSCKINTDCDDRCLYRWCINFYNIFLSQSMRRLSINKKFPNIFTREYINIQKIMLKNIQQNNLNNNIHTNTNGLPPRANNWDSFNLKNIWKQLGCPCVNKMHYDISTLNVGNNKTIINYKNYHLELAKKYMYIYKDLIKSNCKTIDILTKNIDLKQQNKIYTSNEIILKNELTHDITLYQGNINKIQHLINLNKLKKIKPYKTL